MKSDELKVLKDITFAYKGLCDAKGLDADAYGWYIRAIDLIEQSLAELNSYIESRDSEEMVERVAKAIHSQNSNSGAIWDEVKIKTQFINQAKAAIKAMEDK